MCQQVGLQVGALVERLAARGTLVRRLLQMEDLVHGQSPRLAEALAALCTPERLLLAVNIPETDKTRPG